MVRSMGKKKAKKVKQKKAYPTNVDARAKEATAIVPPDDAEFRMDNDDRIEKFLRFKPRIKEKFSTIKEKARFKNNA